MSSTCRAFRPIFAEEVTDSGDSEGIFRALERLKPKIRNLRENFGTHLPTFTSFSGGAEFEYHRHALFGHISVLQRST